MPDEHRGEFGPFTIGQSAIESCNSQKGGVENANGR